MSSELAELEPEADSLPQGWREVLLSEVAEVNPETLRASTSPSLTFGYIDISQIDGPGKCAGWSDQTFGEAPSRARRKVQAGDILVSTVRPYLRSFAQVPQADLPLVASTGFAVVRAGAEADQQFIYQHILHDTFIEHLTPRMTGSNYPAVSASDVEAYPIALPPLDEQRRIAEVLRSVDETIAAAQEVAASMLRANKTMRHELLNVAPDGTISDMPSGWKACDLEALATVERGKFSIRPRNDPRYFGGTTPFIQTGDITSADGYIVRHTQTLNELGVGVSRVFPTGTIMTTIAANIGDFAIATYPVACPDSVVGIEAREGVEPFWLYSVLACFKVALDRAATQNAQKNINLQTLRPLQIPVPPRALMAELAETLSASADGARQANAAVESLMALKKSIQGHLLSGKVRVPA